MTVNKSKIDLIVDKEIESVLKFHFINFGESFIKMNNLLVSVCVCRVCVGEKENEWERETGGRITSLISCLAIISKTKTKKNSQLTGFKSKSGIKVIQKKITWKEKLT